MAKVFKVEKARDLDLTPIMNMVLVLIPLMLLSVVFLTITAIDVTMPQRSAGAASNSGEPPLRLQVVVSRQGFSVFNGPEPIPAIQGCDPSGVTVCVKNPEETVETKRHDWLGLYNVLIGIKNQPNWSAHETIEIVADPKIPFSTIVKVMDIARTQLVLPENVEGATKGATMATEDALNSARPVQHEITNDEGVATKVDLQMFPLVVLGIPVTK